MTDLADPRLLTAAFAVLVVGLCIATPLRFTGDAREYVSMAVRLSQMQPTSLTIAEATDLGLQPPLLLNSAGRVELWHFWLYPLLVAPIVRLCHAFGYGAIAGFAFVNIVLVVYAFWRVTCEFGPWASGMVFVSPVIWWTNKAQVEVFTVSLIAVGICSLRRPIVAAMWFGLAATQNPLVAVLIVVAAFEQLRHGESFWHDRWRWSFVVVLLSLHPAYFLWTLGRPTPLAETGDILIPSLGFALLPVIDPNMGLLWRAPFAVCAVVAAALAARRGVGILLTWALVISSLLIGFAQTTNTNSGGTPHLQRYSLWLLPVTLLLFSRARNTSTGLAFRLAVLASAIWSIAAFRPSAPEAFLSPTAAGLYLWSTHPAWNNPPAEVFAERLRHKDGVNALASTPGCEKVLINDRQWPTGCEPEPTPSFCESVLCYANRRSDGHYDFVVASRRSGWHFYFLR